MNVLLVVERPLDQNLVEFDDMPRHDYRRLRGQNAGLKRLWPSGSLVTADERRGHQQSDGSCEVVFFSGEKITVPKLTDAQVALGSSAGNQGLWLNVLEEAYG